MYVERRELSVLHHPEPYRPRRTSLGHGLFGRLVEGLPLGQRVRTIGLGFTTEAQRTRSVCSLLVLFLLFSSLVVPVPSVPLW